MRYLIGCWWTKFSAVLKIQTFTLRMWLSLLALCFFLWKDVLLTVLKDVLLTVLKDVLLTVLKDVLLTVLQQLFY